MSSQRFDNLGEYLAEFLACLRIEQDDHDRSSFDVQVRDGLTEADVAMLR